MKNYFIPPIAVAFLLIGLSWTALAGPESVVSIQASHDSKLEGTAWVVETINGENVLEDAQPTVTFDHEERVSGNTGCNRFAGAFTEREGLLEFSPIVSTRRACSETVMEQEQMFLKGMQAVRAWVFDAKGLLHFSDANGDELMRLSRIPLKEE